MCSSCSPWGFVLINFFGVIVHVTLVYASFKSKISPAYKIELSKEIWKQENNKNLMRIRLTISMSNNLFGKRGNVENSNRDRFLFDQIEIDYQNLWYMSIICSNREQSEFSNAATSL